MRLTHIDVLPLAAPLGHPFHWSTGSATVRRTTLMRVSTAAGVTGWGETLNPQAAALLGKSVLEALVGVEVTGGDPRLVMLRDELERQGASKGAAAAAVGTLDCAIWDAFAREHGRPLAALLNPSAAEAVQVYASGFYYGDTTPEVEAEHHLTQGFTRFKMKIGRQSVAEDARRIAIVREVIGAAVLLADANSAYDPATASAMADICRNSGVQWLEEPFPTDRADLYRTLRSQSNLDLAAGEALDAIGLDQLLKSGAVDWLQPNVSAAGGVAATLAVAASAIELGCKVALHAWGTPIMTATSLQMASAISPGVLVEIDRTRNPLRAIASDPAARLTGGDVRLTDAPGIGVEVDKAAVEAFLVRP